MSALLISLGTSPAIVPEAFLLPGAGFDAVHVLTTADAPVDFVTGWFAAHAPEVELTVTRVAGFVDFRSEADHFHFEEVLYRWWLDVGASVRLDSSVGASVPLVPSSSPPATRVVSRGASRRPAPADTSGAPVPLPSRGTSELPWVCLAGGYKTMSAAMQKAAAVLGAAEVFHVLAERIYPHEGSDRLREARDAAEIADSAARGAIRWIRLGPEGGWPQFRGGSATDYPLAVERQDGRVRWVTAPDQRFRERLCEIVERSHRIAGAWDRIPTLPFQGLATWSAADLGWLAQPLDPETDHAWVAALPKVELHCHLGGFATHGESLQQVRAAAEEPAHLPGLLDREPPDGWPLPAAPIPLESYMRLGDNNGSALLRDPGCLRRQCELLYDHLRAQNVIYAEIRCSPANYADPSRDRSPWAVLGEIQQAFDRCMSAARHEPVAASGTLAATAATAASPPPHRPIGPRVNLILIATRRPDGARGDHRAAIARHLALAVAAAEHWTDQAACRVVGVDLAGFEDRETRAYYYREEFTGIHRCGLALTVHAGENDDAEGIWSAVFDLNARRLGHALRLVEAPELMRSVAARGIGVEMCPYANFQIKGFRLGGAAWQNGGGDGPCAPYGERCSTGTGEPQSSNGMREPPPPYPLKLYLDEGIRVTVNTDNIGISAASLTDNLLLAARLCPGLTRLDVLRLLGHAIDTAFLNPLQRSVLKSLADILIEPPAIGDGGRPQPPEPPSPCPSP